jgi:hypothetical protein
MSFLTKSIAATLVCFTLAAQELPDAIELPPLTRNEKFLYGSLAFNPGVGLSIRERKDSGGTAIDLKVGAFPFAFDSIMWIPTISGDFNFLYYTREKISSPYLSYGIGATYFIPYVPLRAGYEFENGFIDIGAKMMLGFIPSPEIRGGLNFKF